MNRPAKSLVLQWDKCVEAEPAYNCDDILNAVALLTQEAEEGDLQAQMNEDRQEKIHQTFGQFWCASECEQCTNLP